MKALEGPVKANKQKVADAKITVRKDIQDNIKNFVSEKGTPGRVNNMIIRSIQTNQMIKQSAEFRQ